VAEIENNGDAEYESGVATTCDDCGQPKVCHAFPDPDDPLDYAIEGWVCRPCANGMDAFDV
jgi:hypothetical protein